MQPFKNILVGVDLTRCRKFDLSELGQASQEAIHRAIWLAKVNSAPLLFFAVFSISRDQLQQVHEESDDGPSTIEERANRLMAKLVEQAEQEGVKARFSLALGQAVQEIIQQVQRGGHDLVVAGIRDQTWLSRMIFGNTSLTLLQHCPCPVWVAKPGPAGPPRNILIATDLKASGETALQVGIALGKMLGSTMHVVHPLEYPLDFLWGPTTTDEQTKAYHAKIRAAAERTLREQMRVADPQGQGAGVKIHLVEGSISTDEAIQNFLQAQPVDLLVKGTVPRSGVESLMRGNTAARLLPEVHCSVLAVRPIGQARA